MTILQLKFVFCIKEWSDPSLDVKIMMTYPPYTVCTISGLVLVLVPVTFLVNLYSLKTMLNVYAKIISQI
jgi:hypothetical protein